MLDLEDLAARQKSACADMLKLHGFFAPMILAFAERDGELAQVAPLLLEMPKSWEERDRLADMCRHVLAECKADAYLFVSEVWIGRPVKPEEIASQLTEEGRPSNQPDRMEAVVIHVENKRRERHTELWLQQRDKAGNFIGLVSSKIRDIEPDQFAGRFQGLLDQRTVN